MSIHIQKGSMKVTNQLPFVYVMLSELFVSDPSSTKKIVSAVLNFSFASEILGDQEVRLFCISEATNFSFFCFKNFHLLFFLIILVIVYELLYITSSSISPPQLLALTILSMLLMISKAFEKCEVQQKK